MKDGNVRPYSRRRTKSGWKTYKSSNGADHTIMEGVTVKAGEMFDLQDGNETKAPGKSGIAKHDCNCRCYLEYNLMTEKEFAEATNQTVEQVREKYKTVENSENSGIINTGARITNPESPEAQEHAEKYYGLVRSMTTDTEKIAANIGKTSEEIKSVKDYLFVNNSLYDEDLGVWRHFDSDCAIAQSWQRLIDGKNIQTHDLTLIEHELFEINLIKSNPSMPYYEAHALAQSAYNYKKEVESYYGNLNKLNKK